ncbi:MAG: DNA repair protein RecO [Chloroflexota bacterium]|nr:MAG: DNA repair protein RecO [Chloroflexota bacterium]
MAFKERTLKTEAVVLRHNDWGEADRLLWLYTLQSGKLRANAKGVRKPRSRKAGHLEPFTQVSLLLASGRDMWIVTQAETVNAFLPLREDLLRVGYASYVVELLDRFSYEEGENRAIYHLLVDTLGRLSRETDPILAVRYYEIRLLDYLGFRPQLFQCASCGAEIKPENQYFSALQGGVLCPACGANVPGAWPISVTALKYLRHFQRSNYAEAARARLSPEINRELETLMQQYLTYLLERGLNSPSFLRRVRKEASEHQAAPQEEA